MSSSTAHGRRRAEPAARKSVVHQILHTVPKPTPAGQRLAAVAMAGALIVGMGAANKGLNQPVAAPPPAAANTPISVPTDAAVSFTRTGVKSTVDAHAAAGPAKVTSSSSSVKKITATPTAVNDPSGAQAFAASRLGSFGWGQDQMTCLLPLWNRESDWATTAENPSSLAYGIAQSLPAEKMNSAGADWKTNYRTQVSWGLGYIKDRYGSPCAAWDHEVSIGWY